MTDVLTNKAFSLLDEAVGDPKPFFLAIAPSAPHSNIVMKGSVLDPDHELTFSAPIAAERHQQLFKDLKVPRTPNFNPAHVCLPHSMQGRTKLIGSQAIWRELGP